MEYIGLSNCCPPNVVRTLAEVHNYFYSISDEGVWVNLYGGNALNTSLPDGSPVKLKQETAYPWNGTVEIELEENAKEEFSLFLRIPGWADGATIQVNGEDLGEALEQGTYAEIRRKWKKGDVVLLKMPMEAHLMQVNPLVEENRNQVAVKRGPIVYCLESLDLPKGKSIFDVALSSNLKLQIEEGTIDNCPVICLAGEAELIGQQRDWEGVLYRKMKNSAGKSISLRLVPYFAWGNRGHTDMAVWMPVR